MTVERATRGPAYTARRQAGSERVSALGDAQRWPKLADGIQPQGSFDFNLQKNL